MNYSSFLRRMLTVGLLLVGLNTLAAPPINTLKNSFFSPQTDTAINGYDSVAYLTQNAAIKGQDAHTYEWKGAKWKFSTAANLELFKSAPDTYAPQYGGYCAYGVATDKLVKVDPDQFTVVDGKLYLNYDASIQKDWLKDRASYIKQADQKFLKLLAK
jgi:YHS domain-containing protein